MQPKGYSLQIENIYFLKFYHKLVFVLKLIQSMRILYLNTYSNILEIVSDLIYMVWLNSRMI